MTKKLYQAYQPNGHTKESQEHLLGFHVRRARILGSQYRTRLIDLLGDDLERLLQEELMARSLVSFGTAVLLEVMEIKQDRFKQIKDDIEQGRVPDLDEQRTLLAEAYQIAEEIEDIEQRLAEVNRGRE